MRVSKEDFVRIYIENLKEKYGDSSAFIELLKEEANSLYDQMVEQGVVLIYREKLQERFSLCDKCDWKDECLKVRATKENVCPDLLAPHEILKEILGE